MLNVEIMKKTCVLVVLSMFLVVLMVGCKKDQQGNEEESEVKPVEPEKTVEIVDSEPKTAIKRAKSDKMTLADVTRIARSWQPVFMNWYGKKAPDFTVKSIDGKNHKLSEYKGIDVMLIFWATWCGPCKVEVPDLIALRNVVGKDKLAMLAISNEDESRVRKFAKSYKLNYTIGLDRGQLPAPYRLLQGIPSSFFIDQAGKIKFATSGTLTLGEIKAIINADE